MTLSLDFFSSGDGKESVDAFDLFLRFPIYKFKGSIYVVVQSYLWFKFYFPLFLDMVMYDTEFETREIKFKPMVKLNHNIYMQFNSVQFYSHFYKIFTLYTVR